MNLFPVLFKSLWLRRQNQKIPETSKSMKICCLKNLNMSHNVTLPDTRAIRLLCCQWHISFCIVWELRGQQSAFPWKPVQLFQLSIHPPHVSCFRKLFTVTDLPRKLVYMFLIDFGGYCNSYLLINFLGGEPAVLFFWELTCRGSGLHMELLDAVLAHVLWMTWQEQILFSSHCAGCPGPCLP